MYFRTFPGMKILDLDTWEIRPATKEENADSVKILDALDNHHIMGPYTPYFEVEGIPPFMSIPESVAARIRGSAKVPTASCQLDCAIFTVEMARVAGMEIINLLACAPPLTFRSDAVEGAFRAAEAGFPFQLGGGVLMGATAPVTIAGALQSIGAQNVAAVVLTGLIKPGTRVIVNDFAFMQEMRSGAPAFGGIESGLHQVAFNQIWRKYGIPTLNSAGSLSSSKRIDFQCGYEKAIGTLLGALSGVNSLSLHGGIYGELAWHPVQAILDDDIAGSIGRFVEGIEVNHDTLALDLISEVGPIPGMFLDKEHTRKWWKKEQYLPKSADRLTYPEWLAKGRKSAIDYAKERMEEILATHKPKPLSPEQDQEIERILSEARKYYEKKAKPR